MGPQAEEWLAWQRGIELIEFPCDLSPGWQPRIIDVPVNISLNVNASLNVPLCTE